jgi:hypothetical protein
MILSYSKSFIVLHLQKTGGTSVTNSLKPYLKNYDMVFQDWTRLIYNREGHSLSEHATAMVVSEYLGDSWKNFKVFSTVRNPVDILKSSYAYTKDVYDEHFRGTLEVPPDGSLKALIYSEKSGYGPDGFVDFMLTREYVSVAPQVDRIGSLDQCMVVDLSNLRDSWSDATNYLGYPYHIPLLHSNKSNSAAVEFSDDTVKRIKKHFEKDYDILPAITGVDW